MVFSVLLLAALLLRSSCIPRGRRQPGNANLDVDDLWRDSLPVDAKIAMLERVAKVLPELLVPGYDGDPCAYKGRDYLTLFEMVDAMGKINSNLESAVVGGLMQWLGDYDECSRIDKAHYCSYWLDPVVAPVGNEVLRMC
jgi:hypothetical protein